MAKSFTSILLLLTYLSWISSSLIPYEAEYDAAQKRYEEKEVLDYGDSCSWTDDRKRIVQRIREEFAFSTITSKLTFRRVAQEIEDLILSTGNLCKNGEDYLECRQSTGKCDCELVNSKESPVNITTVREGNACRITRGSTCQPSGVGLESPCVSGTTCKIKSTGVTCTTASIGQELLRTNAYTNWDQVSMFRISYRSMVNGICQCL